MGKLKLNLSKHEKKENLERKNKQEWESLFWFFGLPVNVLLLIAFVVGLACILTVYRQLHSFSEILCAACYVAVFIPAYCLLIRMKRWFVIGGYGEYVKSYVDGLIFVASVIAVCGCVAMLW